jgi:predicted DNA binding CopG/RHH family protein
MDPNMAVKRNDVPVKVDSHVIARARIAASAKGLSLAEYVSETLRPIVERDIAEFAQMEIQAPKKPKGSK